jgi:putative endonuclease
VAVHLKAEGNYKREHGCSKGFRMTLTFLSRIRSVLRRSGKSTAEAYQGKSLNKKKGAVGELEAYHFLRRNGYRIVARNYRTTTGEVDLIGWQDDTLAFVEVKTRLGVEHGRPEESVTRAKQRQICRVAGQYRSRHRLRDISYRFDIVSIQMENGEVHFQLIRDAFKDLG